MKISEKSVVALANIITGNNKISPYRTGPALVEFFNQLGWKDSYEQGFPSRQSYTEKKVQEANGRSQLERIVRASVDPRDFIGTEFSIDKAVEYINKFLAFDGCLIGNDKDNKIFDIQIIDENKLEPNLAANELIKNIIFAANGPKPEIVLTDAITNRIEIVRNAQYCLVYDRKIPSEGLFWVDLIDWWHKKTDKDEREKAEDDLLDRLLKSLNENKVEELIFNTYYDTFLPKLGKKTPALLPQVYLHYDPYTLRSLNGNKRLPSRSVESCYKT